MGEQRSADRPYAGWIRRAGPGVEWSDSVFRLLGLSPDAFAPSLDLLASFLHRDDVDLRSRLVAMLDDVSSEPVGAHLVRRDGIVLQVAFTPSDRGEAGAREICLVDLTPLTGPPGEADEARDLLAASFAEIGDGVLLLGPDGSILRGNAAAYRLLNLDPERGSALWLQYPGLVSDPIWLFFQQVGGGMPRRLAGERWVPALGRWLAYSLTRMGDRTLLVFRDREDVFRLRASLDRASECWSASIANAQAVVIDAVVEKGTLHCVCDQEKALPSGIVTCGDILPDLLPAERARLAEVIDTALASDGNVELDIPCGAARMSVRATARLDERTGRVALKGLAIPTGQAGQPSGRPDDMRLQAPHAVTGAQVRAARGALRWSVRELAEASGVSVATINRFETSTPGSGHARDSNVAALARTLADRGITFFRSGGFPSIGIAEPDVAPRVDAFRGFKPLLHPIENVA